MKVRFDSVRIGQKFFCVYTRDYIRVYEKKSLSSAYCVNAVTMVRHDPKEFGIVGFSKASEVVPVAEAK